MNADKAKVKSIALAAVFFLLGMLCIGVVPLVFLWRLVDAENHFRAQMTFLAAAVTVQAGIFLIDAFLLVMRFGVIRVQKGFTCRLYSFLHVLARVLCVLGNVSLLFVSVTGIILSSAEPVGCVFTLLLFALITAGYILIFRFEKRLKAQHGLCCECN